MPPAAVSIPSQSNGRSAARKDSLIAAVAETIVLAALAGLVLWKGVVHGWRILNSDFPNYYVTARLIREHYSLDRIYDWIWFQRAANHFGVEHQLAAFLGLTPFSALPIVPLAGLPVLDAKRIWLAINLALLVAVVQGLSRATGLSARRSWMVALLAVIPLENNFLLGQMHLLVLALLAAAFISHMRGQQVLSGCSIALAGALKIYPLFFCAYFLVKKRWKALGATLVTFAGSMLLSYAITGPASTRLFFAQQLPRLLQGESQEPFLTGVASSSALFHRLFLFEPDLNPHPLLRSALLFSVFLALWQAVLAGMTLARLRIGFEADDREALEWSSLLALLLVVSSAPATYHFVALIGAAVPTVAVLTRLKRYRAAAVFVFLYAVVCNVTVIGGTHSVSVTTPLHYVKLWAGVALIVFYGWVIASLSVRGEEQAPWWRRPRWQVAAALVCGLWAVGFVNAWHHQRDLCADCERRIPLADGAYLRTAPMETGRGLAYVAMLSDGYRVMLSRGDRGMTDAAPLLEAGASSAEQSDELSFAALRDQFWVETASADGSRIFTLLPDAATASPCVIDGEEPALSADGDTLAFLREERGRGSLWFIDPRACAEGRAAAVRATSSEYDVRTLSAGAAGGFFFSAVGQGGIQGREKVFQWTPRQQPRPIAGSGGDLDAPAASPGGARIAARKLIAGRWQLVSLDLATGAERQLTFSDCNAYAPSWKDAKTILYATDCERGLGLTALARVDVDR